MKHLELCAGVAFVALIPSFASAQGILQRFDDHPDVVAGVGDLDGDGHPEVLVGRTGRFGRTGEVQVVSVLNGSVFRTHPGSAIDDGFATAGARLGDVDGDGIGDYAISTTAGLTPAVRVHSGANGAVLRTILPPAGSGPFGTVLDAEGDVDGDLVHDLLITSAATTAGALPAVRLYSGSSGALLRTHSGASVQEGDFGRAVKILGDVDGDGRDDYAIGNSRRLTTGKGEVQVYSGASGALRYTLNRPGSNPDRFGTAISGSRDVNGDGFADLLVGAPYEGTMAYTTGMVRLYSGFDGRVLLRMTAQGSFEFGQSVLGIADYDGDGVDDILGFSPAVYHGDVIKNENRAFVFSGSTGTMLDMVLGYPYVEFGGPGPVVSAGDLNSDGQEDWLVGGFGNPGRSTAVIRHAAVPLTSSYWPSGCSNGWSNSLGCFPLLDWSTASSLSVGAEPRVTATKLIPNTVGLFLWGSTQANLPFNGQSLCVGPPVSRTPAAATGGTNGTCTGSTSFTFPRSLLLSHGLTVGSQLVVQSWSRDQGFPAPQNRSLTSGVAFTLWP
ncbi:MAG TPA: integrin alpha [Planctomycetota bacterium]|nr:integrin alpha [Planctomycetota bacterium]